MHLCAFSLTLKLSFYQKESVSYCHCGNVMMVFQCHTTWVEI